MATIHDRKVARLQQHMGASGLDAVLLMNNGNTRYVTGYQRYHCESYLPAVHAVLLAQNGGPILMLPEHILHYGARCEADTIIEFPMAQPEQARLIGDLARQQGFAEGRIGVEMDFVPVDMYKALAGALPQADLVDATTCIEETVGVKFPEEIDTLRRAAQITDAAISAIFAAAREGVTEYELASVGAEAISHGAEFPNHLNIRTGENAFELNPVNTGRRVSIGDPINLDIGYIVEGYVSDINRTMILGGPNKEQADILRAVVALERKSIAALRPGVPASEVYDVVQQELIGTKYFTHFRMPFVGHGIGMALHQNPYVTDSNRAPIKAGMVMAMEPGLSVVGVGTCRMEDMVVVTETGCEYLTQSPDDLSWNGLI